MGAVPVLYSFYAIIATIMAVRAHAPLKWRILTPFIVLLSLPFMSYAALKFGEAGMDVLKFVISFCRIFPVTLYLVKVTTSPCYCTRSWPATLP
jgi:hypothetical protein